MTSSRCFDESFLNDRLAKQRRWNEAGLTSGSGKPFEIRVVGKPIQMDQALPNGTVARTSDTAKARRRCSKNKKITNKERSPHRRELDRLDKDPANQATEHYQQTLLFWLLEVHHPELYRLTSAVPMGEYRSLAAAGRVRAEGGKSSYPDITHDRARGIYHGLKIEMKRPETTTQKHGTATTGQVAYLDLLTSEGYYCPICYSALDALTVILQYQELKEGEVMPERCAEFGMID